MDLTVRSRQRDSTPPLPLPPPRVPDRSHSPDDSTPPISTPTGPPEAPSTGSPPRTHPAAGRPPPGNDHHPDGNNGSGHQSATAPGVSTTRRSAYTNSRSAGRPAVSRRDASPTAPTPEGEANPHRGNASANMSGPKGHLWPGNRNRPPNPPPDCTRFVRPPTDRRAPLRYAVTDPPNPPGPYQVCATHQPREHIRRNPPPPPHNEPARPTARLTTTLIYPQVPPSPNRVRTMDHLLDLEWTVVDEMDVALAGVDSPDSTPATPTEQPLPGTPQHGSPHEETRGTTASSRNAADDTAQAKLQRRTKSMPRTRPRKSATEWSTRNGWRTTQYGRGPQAARLPPAESLCWRDFFVTRIMLIEELF
jgi:hypothetical protein